MKEKGANNKKDPNVYPPGWDAEKVREIAEYYDREADEAAIDEAEKIYKNRNYAMVAIPVEILPSVRKLIAKHIASRRKVSSSSKSSRRRAIRVGAAVTSAKASG